MRCYADGEAHEVPSKDGTGAYCPERGVTLLWRGDPITAADVPEGAVVALDALSVGADGPCSIVCRSALVTDLADVRPVPLAGVHLPVPRGGCRAPGCRMTLDLSVTDVRTCEACWRAPVTAVRHTAQGRDLLCRACAEGGCPRRVDLFPPYGIYRLHRPLNQSAAPIRGDGR